MLEDQILRSWHVNAAPWSRAIREGSIASRRVTNAAIVDAVLGTGARSVLDLGCGEGWLVRALCAAGVRASGIDAVAALVDEATRLGGEFRVGSYADIARRLLPIEPVDALVCNFSLLGCESVESLLGSLDTYLNESGLLLVQTLHPVVACGQAAYQDGWRSGSWDGFGAEFSDPPPWYFRTLGSWHAMLRRCGFEVLEVREPTAAGAVAPSSVVFMCGPRRREHAS